MLIAASMKNTKHGTLLHVAHGMRAYIYGPNSGIYIIYIYIYIHISNARKLKCPNESIKPHLIPRPSTNVDNLNFVSVESIPKLSGLKQIGHIFQNAKHGFQGACAFIVSDFQTHAIILALAG